MRAKFVGFLGSCQAFLIMGKGFLWLCGVNVPWVIVLAPLWILLGIAVVFWLLLGALLRLLS
jgi:hypothetical protein